MADERRATGLSGGAVAAVRKVVERVNPGLAAEISWRRNRNGNALFRAVDALVKPGDVAVDIGASRGLFTARLLRLVGRDGHVHAFEPNADSLTALRRLGSPQLTVHAVALSDVTGEAKLRVPLLEGGAESGMGSLELPAHRQDWEVNEISVEMQSLSEAVPADRLDFIKCDVEGHEYRVLTGAADLLRRHRPSLLVEIEQRHQDRDIRDTFALMTGLGYEGWAFFADGLRPLADFDLQRDQLAHTSGAAGQNTTFPPEYVHDFVFVRPGTTVAGLIPAGGV